MQNLPLYPMPLWLTPQIPATTFNAISYEEMIRQFVYKLNQVIKYCNDVQEFSESVKKLLEEFNKTLSDKVTENLTEWYNNGKLQDILENVSSDFFEQLSTELYQILNSAQLSYAESEREIYMDLYAFRESEV